ncbi:MAG: pyridoxal phosphate-dependent aminotransferase [Burkholderiaceae bacterium]|nr:pyridoxal phosphate-dependent aminotransferase [Burkholderiaceae bacterium]
MPEAPRVASSAHAPTDEAGREGGDRAPRARESIRRLPASKIREVADAASGLDGILAFWFGEPDLVTASFIRDAAKAALDAGDTFYHHNLGIAPLREALSDYLSRLHVPLGAAPVEASRIALASAGVNALMLAGQLLLGPGDRVVAVVPLWPNVTEIPRILGAQVVRIGLHVDARKQRWSLDIDRLFAAITPGTRAVIVNSPNNPTGWLMPREQMAALLAHCRRIGCWVISDEAYERLVFDGTTLAPSMLDIADPDDRLIVANTFSKAWQMTGWRLGWLVLPEALVPDLAKLVEFNTSCAPGFVQQAALVALRDGEPVVRAFVEQLRVRRDALLAALRDTPRVRVAKPEGAMYAFFSVEGVKDSLALAKDLVRAERLGLAPGMAFGDEGEGYLRWCFAKPVQALGEGVARLRRHLLGLGR